MVSTRVASRHPGLDSAIAGPNGPKNDVDAVEVVTQMLGSLRVISRGLVAQLAEHLPVQQTVSWDRILAQIIESGAPGETRTPDPLLRRHGVQKSKCRCWCRIRGNASLISPLNWTEDGLNFR